MALSIGVITARFMSHEAAVPKGNPRPSSAAIIELSCGPAAPRSLLQAFESTPLCTSRL